MSEPKNTNLRTEWLPIAMLAITAISGFFYYPSFPDRVPSHWNISGQVDGWSSPLFASFFLPALILIIYLLLLLAPRLDPKKERYQEFGRTYHILKNSIIGFMALLYQLISLNGLGYDLPIGDIVPAMVGLLFILIGNYMSKLKLNWFMGARTPWTLSSETVWNKTNRLSGKLFVLGGLIMVLEIFFPAAWKIPLLLLVVLSVSLFPTIYSYIIFSKEEKNKKAINRK
ncbi:SdpI family protein [Candidatus Falkowbacteria bacterium]|nr:SdpI family protein [Candidatus Falkowbacteria bacterium]